MQRIVTNLWFDKEAEQAAKFYCKIFKNSKIVEITKYTKSVEKVSGKKAGSVLTVKWVMAGQEFVGINGGPQFKFTEAVSLSVSCKNQKEIDYYWSKLSKGGELSQCGWLKDKYGLSWQVSPVDIDKMLLHTDRARVDRMIAAMLRMQKLDIAVLKKAFNSK